MSHAKVKTRAQDRIKTALTATGTTLYVDSITGFPGAPFGIIVDPGTALEELMWVTAKDTVTDTFTVVRAQQGTTAVAHAVGSLVYHSELRPIRAKADDATLTVAEAGCLILVTVDNKTMTLPPAATAYGVDYTIKQTAAFSSGTTIDGDGAETIDGQATVTLLDQYEVVHIMCDGTGWHVI